MKKVFVFNLPEDEWAFEVSNRAFEMNRALSEIQLLVRGALKHGELTLERRARDFGTGSPDVASKLKKENR